MVAQAGGAVTEVTCSPNPSGPGTVKISDPELGTPHLEVSLPGEVKFTEGEVCT